MSYPYKLCNHSLDSFMISDAKFYLWICDMNVCYINFLRNIVHSSISISKILTFFHCYWELLNAGVRQLCQIFQTTWNQYIFCTGEIVTWTLPIKAYHISNLFQLYIVHWISEFEIFFRTLPTHLTTFMFLFAF